MEDGAAKTSGAATPVMAQYLALKARHPDALLFFRMGDFYELFFDDAVRAAAALEIALTRRGQHGGADIPMCGVPVATAEHYLAKLIRAGFRVAVGEQMEDPAEARRRGAKSIVRRDVVRLVTPGTVTEDALLEGRAANRLAAVAFAPSSAQTAIARAAIAWAAIAWADVSTGDLAVMATSPARLGEDLAALAPREILAADRDLNRPDIAGLAALGGVALTPLPAVKADPGGAEARLKALFGVASLDAFGAFTRAELSALGLLVDYVTLTQAGGAPHLRPPRRREAGQYMAIDPATRASLEIDRTQRGDRAGSLLAAIDRTLTSAGARLLADRLARPLADVAAIEERLDGVAHFVANPDLCEGVRQELRTAGDLARAVSRVALRRAHPRDLAAIRSTLEAGDRAARRLRARGPDEAPAEPGAAARELVLAGNPALQSLCEDLARALAGELPPFARDGGFIAAGFDPVLDETRALRDDARRVVAALQADYAQETGLALKIKHNNVLGYHVETSARHGETLLQPPWSARFIHRQTLPQAVRFTTEALADLDRRIARAGDEALTRELALFEAFCSRISAANETLLAAAEALATLDVAAGVAAWALETGAVRPKLDAGFGFHAEGARHPVVEQALKAKGEGFTPNDCRLDGAGSTGARLVILTGPNMAGKSTYLRQNALLLILAQAGLFVPAAAFRAGVADRVFSRVGAADDLARGRSTFMAEMIETAAILTQAGPRAFVILDEIGRGTATYDGLSIAWATAEHLHDVNRARTLFATHYHELTVLADRLTACANASLRAREWRGDLVFLHEVCPGPADRSYGIQVAKLAGLPPAAVARAQEVLRRLESRGRQGQPAAELPLFQALAAEPGLAPAPRTGEIEALLTEIDPNGLTPREALDLIFRLKTMLA